MYTPSCWRLEKRAVELGWAIKVEKREGCFFYRAYRSRARRLGATLGEVMERLAELARREEPCGLYCA